MFLFDILSSILVLFGLFSLFSLGNEKLNKLIFRRRSIYVSFNRYKLINNLFFGFYQIFIGLTLFILFKDVIPLVKAMLLFTGFISVVVCVWTIVKEPIPDT